MGDKDDNVEERINEWKLEAVLFQAQVPVRCGFVVVGLHCLLLSEVGLTCIKGWHLLLALKEICMQNVTVPNGPML